MIQSYQLTYQLSYCFDLKYILYINVYNRFHNATIGNNDYQFTFVLLKLSLFFNGILCNTFNIPY